MSILRYGMESMHSLSCWCQRWWLWLVRLLLAMPSNITYLYRFVCRKGHPKRYVPLVFIQNEVFCRDPTFCVVLFLNCFSYHINNFCHTVVVDVCWCPLLLMVARRSLTKWIKCQQVPVHIFYCYTWRYMLGGTVILFLTVWCSQPLIIRLLERMQG